MERIKAIEERLNKLTLRGHKGFDAREDFDAHAESDIEYLLAENKRLREENSALTTMIDNVWNDEERGLYQHEIEQFNALKQE